jgi:hypothetical protein
LDRLYLNDGKGNFSKTTGALPPLYGNKSSVCAADFDRDGDTDLFIGMSADAKAYGLPQTSYLLLNNGKAHFAVAGKSVIDLEQIGITTASSFCDVNGDGWQDLIIAGEWMPLTIFINEHGKFKRNEHQLPTGLWQSIFVADINGDGYPDILAGNYGLNSKLHASPNEPLKLYVKDIDRNGIMDQILTCTEKGKEYTFLGKDELEKQLPVLKKSYLTYTVVAGKTVDEVFGKSIDAAKVLDVQTLQSGAFINDGKGNFKFEPFPASLQMAPIFAFTNIHFGSDVNAFITGGNYYGVLPYEGRYDAMSVALCFNDNGKFKQPTLLPASLLKINGQIRDIKVLHLADKKKALVLARNNDAPVFLAFKE